MAKDILITPGATNPKIDFTGAGVGAEATTLTVNSDSTLTIGDSGADFLHVGDNVGVGTTSPSEKLHVVGNVLATGDVSATTISSPTIDNLQASATDADNRLDTAETTISQIESDINTLESSAVEADKRSQVIWDHLLPHDQNGNWNANTANGGAAYQQNQGGAGSWMYDDTSVQGVMTVSNGNSTATNSGATKYHTNFSTYLNVDTIYYFRVATGHTTDVCIRFGVTNDSIAATATPQRGAYAQVDTSVDSNIYLVTADDNVRTETDTGLSVTSMNQAFRWFAIRVEDAGGGARAVGLYDVEGGGTLLAKNTTNIPDVGTDSAMRAFIQCIGRGSTYRACYLDTFGVYMPGWIPPNWLH